jgi:hypothetical protein
MSGSPHNPHQHPAFSLPPDDAMESLVNEVIDAESSGREALALTLIRRGVAEFPGFGARLASMRAALKGLRSPVFVPDQRTEVLTEVHTLRPFLTRRERRRVSASRLAIAAGVVLTATVLTVLQGTYPGLAPEQPAPVGTLVDASRADASASVQSLAGVVAEFKQGLAGPVSTVLNPGEAARTPDAPLSLGSIAPYDFDSLRLAPAVQVPRGPAIAAVPASTPEAAPLRRLNDLPLMLLDETGATASVRTLPWPELYVDADGVVLFAHPLQPRTAAPIGVLRK